MTEPLIDPNSLLMALREAMNNNYRINRRINEYLNDHDGQREESRATMTEEDMKEWNHRNDVPVNKEGA